MTLLYEVTVDGEEPTVVTAETLIEAWGDLLAEAAASALDLPIEGTTTVCNVPRVQVRRIR